jgi:hypothetical protein
MVVHSCNQSYVVGRLSREDYMQESCLGNLVITSLSSKKGLRCCLSGGMLAWHMKGPWVQSPGTKVGEKFKIMGKGTIDGYV